MNRPTNPGDLWAFIKSRFRLALPDNVWTPGHSSPFRLVSDAFFHPNRDLAAWANRSGLKTLAASIVAALEFCFSKAPIRGRVLSGSEDQARNLYGYWERWCGSVLEDRVKDGPGRLLTRLDNGDFEILAASQKRVRGAKVQRLFRDEVDEIDPELMGASVGMLASRDGVAARTIDTSTWHHADGPMGRLVASAAQRGIVLHKWNIWESIARCPRNRHEGGRNCGTCRLGPPCLAKAREFHADPDRRRGIASQCNGLLAIDDAIKQFSQWSLPQWQAEAECRRPSVEGLVYPAFDRTTHVRADLDYDENLPTWRAIDWGWNNFVCLWIQADKAGCVRVVEEYWATTAVTADHARRIGDHDARRRIEATYCDPAGASPSDQTGRSDVAVFAAMGVPCTWSVSPWARQVANGVNLVRSFLTAADGRPRLLVAGRCQQLIGAFESYRNRQVNGQYVDEPVKPQACDHPMDALRYYFVNRWPPHRTETRRLGYA